MSDYPEGWRIGIDYERINRRLPGHFINYERGGRYIGWPIWFQTYEAARDYYEKHKLLSAPYEEVPRDDA